MRTNPFELLGVPIDASDAEIDQAWRAKLRASHPDSHPDATPELRTELQDYTQALNEARELLRDPHSRALASQSLVRAVVTANRPSTPAAPEGWTPPLPTRATYEPRQLPEIMHRRVGRGWIVAVLVIALALGGFALYRLVLAEESGSTPETTNQPELQQFTSLSVEGTPVAIDVSNCVVEVSAGTVQPIPCEQPHAGVVTATAAAQDQCPPETKAVVVDHQPLLCVELGK